MENFSYYPIFRENCEIILIKIDHTQYEKEILDNGNIILKPKKTQEQIKDYKREMETYMKELFENENVINIKNNLIKSMDGSQEAYYKFQSALAYYNQIKNNIYNSAIYKHIDEEIKMEIFGDSLMKLREIIDLAKIKNEQLAESKLSENWKKYNNYEYAKSSSWYQALTFTLTGENEKKFIEEINKLDKDIIDEFKISYCKFK
jgi:hypothetical protein